MLTETDRVKIVIEKSRELVERSKELEEENRRLRAQVHKVTDELRRFKNLAVKKTK